MAEDDNRETAMAPASECDEPAHKVDEAAVGRSAAMMSVLVIISRLTGFLRTWAQAFALGTTALSSCYTVANNLPNLLYELVLGGMIITAFLPVYLSVKNRLGQQGANAYVSNLLGIVLVSMGALTILSLVFGGAIVWTQSFSASADFDAELATWFFRFFAIEVMLYGFSSTISGVLNAERDYLWSNAAPIFNNVVCTASFFAFVALAQSNPALGLLCLALGNPLGVLVQVLVQVPALRRHGVSLKPRINLHDPALKETLTIGIPTLVMTVASFPTVAVQTSCALQVTAAGASVAYYSRLWYMLPYSVFAIPVTVAMFTELSQYVAEDDMASFRQGVRYGTGRILIMLVPFAMFLIVFAPQLITILAMGGFDEAGLRDTITYLSWLAPALPFYGLSSYLQKICSSLREMKVAAVATIIAAVVQIAFCFLTTEPFGLPAVAFSSTLFFIVVDAVMFWHVRKVVGQIGLRPLLMSAARSVAFGLAGCAVAIGVMWLLGLFAGTWEQSPLMSLVYCVAAGVPALVATYGLAALLKAPEASTATSLVRRLLKR